MWIVVGGCVRSVMTWCGHFSADSLVPLPLVPPYHLCLPHLKGWFLPLLLSPFVFLTNVAALEGNTSNSVPDNSRDK